jgi:putative transposase
MPSGGVGCVRRECLDRLLIVGRRHLESVVKTSSRRYNEHRPHRSLGRRPLGGLIREYQLAA